MLTSGEEEVIASRLSEPVEDSFPIYGRGRITRNTLRYGGISSRVVVNELVHVAGSIPAEMDEMFLNSGMICMRNTGSGVAVGRTKNAVDDILHTCPLTQGTG